MNDGRCGLCGLRIERVIVADVFDFPDASLLSVGQLRS